MDNMKTANIQRQSACFSKEGGRLETCNRTMETEQSVCTIAVYEAGSQLMTSPPPHLPPPCEAERLRRIDYPGHVGQTGNSLKIIITQAGREQEGTYVCSILRTCNPPYNQTLEEDQPQEIISVSKQLYLKVYQEQNYRADYLVSLSVLGGASLLLLLSALFSQHKTDRIDHL